MSKELFENVTPIDLYGDRRRAEAERLNASIRPAGYIEPERPTRLRLVEDLEEGAEEDEYTDGAYMTRIGELGCRMLDWDPAEAFERKKESAKAISAAIKKIFK